MVRKYKDLDKDCPITANARGAFNHAQIAADLLTWAMEQDGKAGLTDKDIADIKRAIDLELDWGTVACVYDQLAHDLDDRPNVHAAIEKAKEEHGPELLMRALGGEIPPGEE